MKLDNFSLLATKKCLSVADTGLIGRGLAAILKPGMVIGFYGELGVGKTELVRTICDTYGIKSEVTSPTYTLENRYLISKEISISHWDLYRLSSHGKIDSGEIHSEIAELKQGQTDIIIIEWPDLVEDLLDLMLLISFPSDELRSCEPESRVISFYIRTGLSGKSNFDGKSDLVAMLNSLSL